MLLNQITMFKMRDIFDAYLELVLVLFNIKERTVEDIKQAKERKVICTQCNHKKRVLGALICTQCSCVISVKVNCVYCQCPLSKWLK